MASPPLTPWPQRPLFADTARPDEFIFFDCETTGLSPDFDQIIQLALVRTDADFRIADPGRDVKVWRPRRMPWVVPSPAALLKTKTELSALDLPTLLPQEMMLEVAETLTAWEPAIAIGFNSARFDIQFQRRAFMAALLNPYSMPGIGSLHADAMTIAQAVHVLAPGAIVVPPLAGEHATNSGHSQRSLAAASSRRSFKLQFLAEANGIVADPATAHDALADAMTTMALMRLMRERAPEIVDAMIELASKWSVIERLEKSSRPGEDGQFQPLALIKVIGGSTLTSPLMALGPSVHQPGRFTAVDLAFDPNHYLSLDDGELTEFIAEHRHAFPKIKANGQPILIPLGTNGTIEARALALVRQATNLDLHALRGRMASIYAAGNALVERVGAALTALEPSYPQPVTVEQRLYADGFVSRADAARAARIADKDPAEMAEYAPLLADERLREYAKRWAWLADSSAVPATVDQAMRHLVQERLLSPADRPWRTIAAARNETIALRIAAAQRNDKAAVEHLDRIALELFFIEEAALRTMRAQASAGSDA